jgi:drug/metabolite transporter (DMT)-like permease
MGVIAVAGRRSFHKPRLRDLPGICALGALGFALYHSALNYGQVTVTSGSASFLTESAPIFATLLAVLFLGERLSAIGWTGLAVCLGGAGLIAVGEANGPLAMEPGALLILLAAVSGAGYFTLQKSFLRRYGSMEITAYAMWAGTLLMSVWAPGLTTQVATAPLEATLAVAYIGVFPGAIGYVTYAYVLSELSVARGTSLLYLVPLAVIPIAWVWHGEVPTLAALAGGALILVGVALVQRKGRPKRVPAAHEKTAA